jgi:hypothetical protein
VENGTVYYADAQNLNAINAADNLVFAASATPLPTEWLPRLMAAGPHPAKVAEGREVEQFIGGALPSHDADSTASPKPSLSLFER